MKKFSSLTIALLICVAAFAQKAELSVIANGGLFHFTGISSAKQSFLNSGTYTNDIYGNRNAFSYGGALQLKLISKSRFIAGVQGGYEVLRSRVDILQPNFQSGGLFASSYPSLYVSEVKGRAILKNTFLNISPFIGYRLIDKNYTLDILPGVDFGIGLSGHEYNEVVAAPSGTEVKNTVDRGKPSTDFRLRFGAEAGYKRWALSASYASGKSNYLRDFLGISGNPKAYSSLFRFGLGYKLF